ncbi:MAG: hypothetical protein ACFFCS_09390 [Candidatus Hodarchaeota archaeon]
MMGTEETDMQAEIEKQISKLQNIFEVHYERSTAWAVHVDKRVDDWKRLNTAFKNISGKYGSKRGKGWPGFIFEDNPKEALESSEEIKALKEELGLKFYVFEIDILKQDNRVDKEDWGMYLRKIRTKLYGRHTHALNTEKGEAGCIIIPKSLDDPVFHEMREDKKKRYKNWKESKKKNKIHVVCPVCGSEYDIEIPELLIEDHQVKGVTAVTMKLKCGHNVQIKFDSEMNIKEIKEIKSRSIIVDFDVNAFLDGNEELSVLFPHMFEEDMLGRPRPKLGKSISELVPTTVEMKTEEQIQADEEKHQADLKTEVGMARVRAVEFQKALYRGNKYKVKQLSKQLHGMPEDGLISFIDGLKNPELIKVNKKKNLVEINDPSDDEIDVLVMEFEKFLKFGSE